MTAKIYTVANHKGGCSKTTTVKAMAEILSRQHEKKVLCIDSDPQGNFTTWSGIDTEGENTLYELLSPNCTECTDVEQVIRHTDDYDIIPADMALAGVVNELTSLVAPQSQFVKYLLPYVKENYDYVLIDTPPALNNLAINAFVVSDGIIIATDSNMFATCGIYKFFETIDTTREFYNSNLKVCGVLLTKFDKRFVSNKVIAEVTEQLTGKLNIPMFDTRIRTSVDMTLATTYSMSLLDLTPTPKPVEDYENFVNEFLAKEEKLCNA